MVDYDPWGLELSGLGSGLSNNRSKFNGKETLAELGGGLLDFGARGYDATIGRMHQVDAASELFQAVSGYNYGLNNPIFNIDPTGDTTVPYQEIGPKQWPGFNTQTNDIGLSEVSVKRDPADVLVNTNAYIGHKVMEARSGFFDKLDQFLNGNRVLLGLQVNKEGILTSYSSIEIGTPPDIGLKGVGIKIISRTPSRIGHIFRVAEGHVNPITVASQNRYIRLFENIANNPNNLNPSILSSFQRSDGSFQGFSQTFRNGKQVWAQVKDNEIINAGVNLTPK